MLLRCLVLQSSRLHFPSLDPLSETSDPRLELRAFDQAFGVAVYETSHAAAQFGELRFNDREIEAIGVSASRNFKAPFVLGCNPPGVTQDILDFLPHSRVQNVGTNLDVRTYPQAIGAINAAAGTSVVGVFVVFASWRAHMVARTAVGVPA
ncbi:hypothetical protein [Paracraurococcus lichenis]|uniref:Uncharacterized protein n=1 Tax=Paracraurococcus lichenis TaxID=3064888 RepID=A0ABT9EE38_9PROT|nr:hypothetical protein [Paracraurococcus sp. LOR1-02]MDO9714356.1 hypothetical protein [Paracraurococcus sp. LOR1-02]